MSGVLPKGTLKDIGKYSSVGLELAICVLVGMAIGYFIDKKIEVFRPWSTLIFTLLGFLAGLKRLFALSRAKGKDRLKNGNERG